MWWIYNWLKERKHISPENGQRKTLLTLLHYKLAPPCKVSQKLPIHPNSNPKIPDISKKRNKHGLAIRWEIIPCKHVLTYNIWATNYMRPLNSVIMSYVLDYFVSHEHYQSTHQNLHLQVWNPMIARESSKTRILHPVKT